MDTIGGGTGGWTLLEEGLMAGWTLVGGHWWVDTDRGWTRMEGGLMGGHC